MHKTTDYDNVSICHDPRECECRNENAGFFEATTVWSIEALNPNLN